MGWGEGTGRKVGPPQIARGFILQGVVKTSRGMKIATVTTTG